MKFNAATDIDPKVLLERSREESAQIYARESTRRNRTMEEIVETSMYGLAAEVYLMQEGYIDDDRPYKDLFEPVRMGGKSIEVKVTSGEHYVPYVLERCDSAAKDKWREYPEKLYVFIGNKETLDYHLQGIYTYDGVHFIKDVV
jgi:hypothetical protein